MFFFAHRKEAVHRTVGPHTDEAEAPAVTQMAAFTSAVLSAALKNVEVKGRL